LYLSNGPIEVHANAIQVHHASLKLEVSMLSSKKRRSFRINAAGETSNWPRNVPAGLIVAVEDRQTEEQMPTEPTIARIWRGRTRPEIADRYEAYIKAEGIPPLEKTALGVQLFREDREHESWFTTISYWSDLASMTAFTKGEPTKVHHLDRDGEFLIELPEFIQIHRILMDRQGLR
jgi:hypothetical protein